jgi:hypothetical protein
MHDVIKKTTLVLRRVLIISTWNISIILSALLQIG